jgi:hypothetical protein
VKSFCTSKQSKLSITEYDTIEDVALLWDEILPENHSLLSINLRVLELSKPADMQFKYLMIQKAGVLKGLVYLQHLKITNSHFDGTAIDKPGLGWLKKVVNNQFSDVLICGNLFRVHFPGYFFVNPEDNNLIFEVLTDYLNSERDHCKFCGILLKDCPTQLKESERFKPYHDDVTMELEMRNEWLSIDDYRKSLDKKYRQRCAKIQKAKQTLLVKELTLTEIVENSQRIQELYENVAFKQALRIGFVNAAYFVEMKRRHGDDFVLKAYYLEGKMVAFSSYIMYPDNSMEIHFIGLDYEFNETYCLYFNILFDGVEMAIKHKASRLELGRTARVAKASVGALPVEVHNYIFLKKGIPSLAFSFFNSWFIKNIGEDWKNRNPFKSTLSQDLVKV